MTAKASLDRLAGCLAKLPGVGRRSAERMALHLVRERGKLLKELLASLTEAGEQLCCCARCGSITPVDSNPCDLCTSPRRDASMLCVVEDPGDIVLIERSGAFHGRYHALMGRLSPLRGEGRNDIRVEALVRRVRDEQFTEVILATNTDVEGESTAGFLTEVLRPLGVRISRLALGIPAGSGIRYSDPVTLGKAINYRHEA